MLSPLTYQNRGDYLALDSLGQNSVFYPDMLGYKRFDLKISTSIQGGAFYASLSSVQKC